MKSVALHNLGCKVNSYELDVMGQKLQENGYTIVPFDAVADIYIVNTCSVTNIADRKSRQMLHQAKKRNPKAIVVATGCYVQTGKEQLEQDLEVDLLIGNQNKKEIVEILEQFIMRSKEMMEQEEQKHKSQFERVTDISVEHEYEEMTLEHTADHTRAYIKIQDGCNQFCSYCIIPYARGRVRSRPEEKIIQEVNGLVHNGFQEIVITGIHISSYGMDWKGEKNLSKGEMFDSKPLLHLLEQLNQIKELKRIRIGSLEPRIITSEFTKGIAKINKICPHFHLSLQSGSDKTLQRMNRQYTTKQYLESVELLRTTFSNPAITTDVITGFPGETEEEFQETVSFIQKVNFYEMHIFPYSKRKGTPAASFKEQVDNKVKKLRSDTLIKISQKQSYDFRKKYLGHEVEVLLEEEKMIGETLYLIGHTREYIRCAVKAEENQPGKIVKGIPKKILEEDLVWIM